VTYIPLETDEREPRQGYNASMSQRIVNDLPMWHAGRRLRTSNFYKILNALFGKQAEEFSIDNTDSFIDSYLDLVNTDAPDIILKSVVPANIEIRELEHLSRNLIQNGAFRIRTSPHLIGDGWEYSGTVILGVGYIGNTCPVITNSTGGYVQQTMYVDIPTGTPLCASTAYKIATWSGGTSTTDTGHALTMTVYYRDATTAVATGLFDAHTAGGWEQKFTTLTTTKPAYKILFKISTGSTATFPITSNLFLDACMLEQATKPSQWMPSRLDIPHYLEGTDPAPVDFDAEYPLYYVDNLKDFWHKAVPTRAGIALTRTNTISAATGVGQVKLVDFFEEEWLAEFDISGNKIRKIGITCAGEVYGSYDLAFINYRGRYEVGHTYTIKALAYYHDQLWAIVDRGANLSEHLLVLCLINPNVPSPEPDYLEVIAAVELEGVPLNIDRMEFRKYDQQHIYVGNATSEYRLRLYYDYYMFDSNTYASYLREEYDELVLLNEPKASTS